MKEKRREFFVLTAAAFLTGAVLYGAMGLYAALSGLAVWGQHTAPALAASTTALAGGYFFFLFCPAFCLQRTGFQEKHSVLKYC